MTTMNGNHRFLPSRALAPVPVVRDTIPARFLAFPAAALALAFSVVSPASAQLEPGDPGEIPADAFITIPALLYTEEVDLEPVEGIGSDLRFDKVVSWKDKASASNSDTPTLEFTNAEPMTLSCELFFDTYETKESVRIRHIEPLLAYTKNVSEQTKRPPICLFQWGEKFPRFQGVIESLRVKYTMFLADGTPVRARCAVTLKQAKDVKEKDREGPRQ